MIKNISISIALLATFLLGCKQASNEQVEKTYKITGDTVHISQNRTLLDKLVLKPVEEESFSREIALVGTVQGIPTQLAYIAPPFSGRVIKSYIKLGQKVNINTPLFEISSSEFTTAQKEFFQAQSARTLANNDMKRKTDLVKNGVASQREYEEVESTLQVAEKEYENAYAAIKIFQANPEDMTLGQPLIVRSPIRGEVTKNNLVTGLYINRESDPIATISDLSKVWVAAQVKEKDIRFIHKEDKMIIRVLAIPDHVINGEIFHIDEAVDEDTRSIKVLCECDNKDGILRTGMYATVHFQNKSSNHLIISDKALLQDDKDSYVFLQVAPYTFIKTAVEAEVLKDGRTIIHKGLTKGDVIISEGGYYIK